ncbi:MAG: hydrogenase maturation nickel metallochaperone HypA [Endomicrobiia bacterium]
MHELGLAKDLASIIFNTMQKEGKDKKLKKVVIVIGQASGIEKDFLNHSLKDHIFKGTEFENVEIEYKIQKVEIKCKSCEKIFTQPVIKCDCGNLNFDIKSGKDVFIEKIEVE